MDLDWCRKLYGHMEWGDALVWRQVLAHDPSSEDPFVRESLLHIHYVQRAYLAGWTEAPLQRVSLDDFSSLRAVRDWGRAFYSDVAAYFESLEPADFGARRSVLWADLIEEAIGQPPVPATLGDMVFQVASHGIHHRAQVNRRLREVGGEPAFVDYVAWVWLDRPEADWT